MPDGTPARAYLSLGSNIDPEVHLPAAVRELSHYGRVVRTSRVWQTPPVGFAGQSDYLNAAVLLETPLSPADLRDNAIDAIERRLGRVRDPQNVNAPRTIDIDIVLYNRDVIVVGNRRIPHPDLLTRAFVAIPVAELDPEARHPETGQTLAEIAAALRAGVPEMHPRPDVQLPCSP